MTSIGNADCLRGMMIALINLMRVSGLNCSRALWIKHIFCSGNVSKLSTSV